MVKNNPHTGSNFDDFLKEQGFYKEVTAKALKRAISEQLHESMLEQKEGFSHGSGGMTG